MITKEDVKELRNAYVEVYEQVRPMLEAIRNKNVPETTKRVAEFVANDKYLEKLFTKLLESE